MKNYKTYQDYLKEWGLKPINIVEPSTNLGYPFQCLICSSFNNIIVTSNEKTQSGYWCNVPPQVNKRSELRQVMEKRIKILENIIKNEDLSNCIPMIYV